jgi:preprotein translocase subunit Sec61beta
MHGPHIEHPRPVVLLCVFVAAGTCFSEPLPSSAVSYGPTIPACCVWGSKANSSLLLFFENKESKPKLYPFRDI